MFHFLKFLLLFLFFQPFRIEAAPSDTPPLTIVIFGATGDLTARKLIPALYRLYEERKISEDLQIIGFARRPYDDSIFRQTLDNSAKEFVKPLDPKTWEIFIQKISYISSGFDQEDGYHKLKTFFKNDRGRSLYYLATPPQAFGQIIEKLASHELTASPENTRVIIEKPFGTDLNSALELQQHLLDHLQEEQIYRMDHYLAKPGLQQLLDFRFIDQRFEPYWNRDHISKIQISLSEELGIESRGNFWEETGAMRDFFQNHLLQMLAITAMDSPAQLSAEEIHAEKIKLLSAIEPIQRVVRGQYGPGKIKGIAVPGYRQENNVAPDSNVETYVAAELMIANDRWKNVPFYLYGGKRLDKQEVRIKVSFKGLPSLDIRIQPEPSMMQGNEKITLENSKTRQDAYEQLLLDAANGDRQRFVWGDEQIVAWMLVSPILYQWKQNPPEDSFPNYSAGEEGPQTALRLIEEIKDQIQGY